MRRKARTEPDAAPVVDAATDVEPEPPPAPPPLGPGDDDPRSQARGEALVTRGPLTPGESDPKDGNRNFKMLAQPAPGPGDTFVQRRITVFQNDDKE